MPPMMTSGCGGPILLHAANAASLVPRFCNRWIGVPRRGARVPSPRAGALFAGLRCVCRERHRREQGQGCVFHEVHRLRLVRVRCSPCISPIPRKRLEKSFDNVGRPPVISSDQPGAPLPIHPTSSGSCRAARISGCWFRPNQLQDRKVPRARIIRSGPGASG